MGSGQSNASAAEGNNWKWSTGKRKRDSKMKVPPHAESSRVLFLLYLIHRTWNVVIEHVDSKSARWRGSQTTRLSNPGTAPRESQLDALSLGHESDAGSQYSFCSCSYCRMRDDADDLLSNLTDCEIMASQGAWNEDHVAKEKQRPPIYNAEDYALSLRKWGRKGPPGAAGLYSAMLEPPAQETSKARTLPNQTSKDYRNPCLSPGEEMSLRQFGTASELLTKLRADLRLAFPSFVQEFVCEDGVALLLELLRGVQASQAGSPAGAPPTRPPPAVARRALLDELSCLQCLWSCCTRYPEASRKLVAGSCGLYTLTVCIMSTVNKSRILALQLLTKACNPPANGHVTISEALSTLRLRFGEPVRFRFLVGMLLSGGGSGELQAAGLGFLNALLASAPGPQRKLYLQAELEQAGFDIVTFRKMISKNTNCSEQIVEEIEQYEKQLIDIDTLSEKATEAEKEKDDLKTKLDLLEKRVKILQEEKGILMSLEKCLKVKCCELQEEVTSLRSEHGNSNRKKLSKNKLSLKRDESSPPEDEGISSSERSLSPDDLQREPLIYEVFNVKSETFDLIRNNKHIHKKFESKRKVQEHNVVKKISDDEEETTIDEVIEELRNIVNDAESEQYAKENMYGDDSASRCNQTSEINVSIKALETRQHKQLEKEDSITSTRHSIHIVDSTEYLNEIVDAEDELEIVPTKILPHPPRKSKSLVHLFVPPADQGVLYNKQDHLYDDGCYSSDEGSDSLLSASRYQNQYKKGSSVSTYDTHDIYPNNNRALLNSIMDARDRVHTDTKEHIRLSRTRSGEALCRKQSLKRSESFQHTGTRTDTVVSDHFIYSRGQIDSLFYGNETNTSPFGTVNNLNRSDSKCNFETEECNPLADSKILTKSLDRIDEGLDSMVDIVMLPESKKTDWPYDWKGKRSESRANSEIGNQSPTSHTAKSNVKYNSPQHSTYRHDSKVSSRKDDRNSPKLITDASQRFFIPHPKLSTASVDNNSLTSYNNSSFMIKRGHTNAGYYSGQPMLRDAPASMTSLGLAGGSLHSDVKRTLSPTGPKSLSGQSTVTTGKVTDIPSGLY